MRQVIDGCRGVVRALCLALLLAGAGSAAAQERPTVHLMVNTSPPYSDSKLPEQGLAVELVRHIFDRAGYDTEFTVESWTRAMEGVRIGLYDALAAAWYTEERAQEYRFSEPYLGSRLVLVKLRSTRGDYFELSHLAGKRLGVRTDYAYGVDFSAVPDLVLVQENHLIQNLLNLLQGKVDFVIGDQRTLMHQIHRYLQDQSHKLEVVDVPLPERKRHVAASRALDNNERIVRDFNAALAETLKDGSHAAIIAKWQGRYENIGD